MSTTNVSQALSPMKGDIVLTRKGHRRLWDGRHWRVLCRIPNCTAQRQGSLYNKFGLCKKHFTQMEFNQLKLIKSSCLLSNIKRQNQLEIVSEEEKKKIYKRRNLNIIIDQLRHTQTRSEPCSDE
jgi:hypothetical protein